ncbi:MAG: hypothetical protein HN548_10840 [Opitutae bacterium]|jgi:hypothetical protein|nr:hypothetical protein [Opitutae bacterium]MBT5717178.1 hypothetical protein [Opitutae bacterium]
MVCDSEINKEERLKWGEVILQHSFDEEDWYLARSSLIKLLSLNNKYADEDAIRSYICCCAEATSGTIPLPPLKDLVSDFYNHYGMESAKEK